MWAQKTKQSVLDELASQVERGLTTDEAGG